MGLLAVRVIFFMRVMTARVITDLDDGVGVTCKFSVGFGEIRRVEGVLPA